MLLIYTRRWDLLIKVYEFYNSTFNYIYLISVIDIDLEIWKDFPLSNRNTIVNNFLNAYY